MSEKPVKPIAPFEAHWLWAAIGRLITFPCYPTILPFAIQPGAPTAEMCTKWSIAFPAIGIPFTAACHALCYRWFGENPYGWKHVCSQIYAFFVGAYPFAAVTWATFMLKKVYSNPKAGNRLKAGKLYGKKVIVIGNGPSAVEGDPLGAEIDGFDEVVRFNNFQTKTAGMEKFVGTKTTVHYSDGVLFPTFPEYHVPGANVVLSLIKDRFMVGITYICLRGIFDLQPRKTVEFLLHPDVYWSEEKQIHDLKDKLGIKDTRHPTSGMLGIDYFVNKEGVELPVYIHGFDFFQGPKMHYFDEHEPLYERLNDRIGVNAHCPWKEKDYVQGLIDQGKVAWLKDLKKKK
eukprot:TRINITY_DN8598_c0_g2_i2.p1 TRINITY_DN8598_c0_g2~~TRINITY_DN8598_c0_g2_i2.p1  ORF type:complete len:345 (-),score=57.51 TRINITY_DN8598_c0_g2_i2:267-1301(-)